MKSIFFESKLDFLRLYTCDTDSLINLLPKNHYRAVVEGANATMLDTIYGTYPYVTSTRCDTLGILSGAGFRLDVINHVNVIGVAKGAYVTRVGGGCLPTEDNTEYGEKIQAIGAEFGVTTGRKRRCGHQDAVELKFACQIMSVAEMNLTKLDIFSSFKTIKVCIDYKNPITNEIIITYPSDESSLANVEPVYMEFEGWYGFDFSKCTKREDLHPNCLNYITYLENYLNVKINYINTGKLRGQLITN